MTAEEIAYVPELPAHEDQIERINAQAFGPGRFARATYRIREGGPHDRSLSFVALKKGEVVASVRMTRIAAGEGRAVLLGPLAVRPDCQNVGIGRRLVGTALEAARQQEVGAVLLVGDEPYYGPLGFRRVPRGQIHMPHPVDLDRILAAELQPGAVSCLKGQIRHADRAER